MPSQITFGDGNTIDYEYGSDGRKLRTVHQTGNTILTTDYCGNAIYENGSLKLLLTETGYVSFPDKKFHFCLKDHQGNVRVVADKDGKLEEMNDYYPFGGIFTTSTNVQPYKYNGKELDRASGLNLYDYGARHYDAAIGKWYVQDPLNEMNNANPYLFCFNNPLRYVDIMGLDTIPVSQLPEKWSNFNENKDVVSLNEVAISGNLSEEMIHLGINMIGAWSTIKAGSKYTEYSWPLKGGYFINSKGKRYPIAALKLNQKGKVRGVKALRRDAAKVKKLQGC